MDYMYDRYYDLYYNDDIDLKQAVTEYLAENGITCKVDCEFDPIDEDYSDYELCVSWEEDDDRQTFYTKVGKHTQEELFDLWVAERESRHAEYLIWLTEEA